MSESPVFEMQVRVRYSETDPMGFVHHSRYPVYFEMARTEMLRACGMTYRALEEKGVLLAVTKLTCSFKAPAAYDDVLTIEAWIDRWGAARIDHSYRVWTENRTKLVAEGASTLACLDREGNVQALPDDIRDLLEKGMWAQ